MSIFTIILVWLFWICYIMEILPICQDLKILYVDVWWSYDMYILETYDLYPLRLLRNFIYACYLNYVEDVASISWIFALFTCIIALIEIGRYKLHITQILSHDYTVIDSRKFGQQDIIYVWNKSREARNE